MNDLGGIKSGTGVAMGAAVAGVVQVNVNGVQVGMYAAQGATYALGDPVAFMRVGNVWVIATKYGISPVSLPAIDPPPSHPATVTGLKTFTPVETRSRRGSIWRTGTDDVVQGQYGSTGNNTGCAFYGSGPRALAGATVTSASVTLQRAVSGGSPAAQDTEFWLVTQTVRPAGAPTLTLSTDGPDLAWGELSSFTVPTAWAQAMVDGTAGGLAIFQSGGSPYVILDGRGRFTSSFALTIRYSRTF